LWFWRQFPADESIGVEVDIVAILLGLTTIRASVLTRPEIVSIKVAHLLAVVTSARWTGEGLLVSLTINTLVPKNEWMPLFYLLV
jgi:hypothetical protein